MTTELYRSPCHDCLFVQSCRIYPLANCALLNPDNINDIAGVQVPKGYGVVSRTIPLGVPLPQLLF